MQFGMPTLIELDGLPSCVKLCKELGLDFIELNMNLPEYQTNMLDIGTLNKIRKTEGIYFTIHLDENLNVCDFNPLVADAYMSTVLHTVEIAKKISAPVLNMHMAKGVYFTLPDHKEFLFSRYRNAYLNTLRRFRDSCDHAAAVSGIKICIENTNGYPDFVREGIELLLESNCFALTLDTGHSFCAGGVDEPFILAHVNRLCHMHLHDAAGSNDHLPLGTGALPLEKYRKLAQRNGCRVVLETKTAGGLRESVQNLNRLI